jgi:ribosomal protein S18 acetylase RimI-like enzyme
MNRYALVSRNGMPRDTRHYLVKIGVLPNHQGEGLGKCLIRKIIEHTRQKGQSLGLDTENPANVPLYQHLGFKLQGQKQLEDLTIYQMRYRWSSS